TTEEALAISGGSGDVAVEEAGDAAIGTAEGSADATSVGRTTCNCAARSDQSAREGRLPSSVAAGETIVVPVAGICSAGTGASAKLRSSPPGSDVSAPIGAAIATVVRTASSQYLRRRDLEITGG